MDHFGRIEMKTWFPNEIGNLAVKMSEKLSWNMKRLY